jgi:L-threonylcarbamoyladenylate synthase
VPTVIVDPAAVAAEVRARLADWLASGGLVVYPTDTLYGLGAVPTDEAAVAAIFDVKGRDERQALPIIAASIHVVRALVPAWPDRLDRFAATFWPGPLSIVVPAPQGFSRAVHGGLETMAVRVPDHPIARIVAEAAGGFVTATSANRSGASPVHTASDVDEIRHDPRVLLVDGGRTPGGAPSTIVDCRSGSPVIVRAGAISAERVMAAWRECG